ncbi:MAG: hypothetical protein JWO05_2241 [Gemmatimonadetes bacterium]|nr:hypothetical protein [Gemmatimonadota bacterium]
MLGSTLTRASRLAKALTTSAFALALLPAALFAQSGRIVGTVSDPTGAPVAGAQVLVQGTALSGAAGSDGRFVIRSVPAGTYSVKAYRIGFHTQTQTGVAVAAGADATIKLTLTQAPVQLGGVVTSASRRVEKITEAPATITHIDDVELAGALGNSFGNSLKDVKGIEFIRVGVMGAAINARGFNSSFNNRMLQTEDGRISVLAESGLPVGGLTTINKLDIAGIEVLVGPGAALYGPDASNGVITTQTKDPRQFPGLSMELDGGSRSFLDAQARYAGVTGNWGYKISGERVQANEWDNSLYYPAVVAGTPALAEKGADWKTSSSRGSGSLAYYLNNGGRVQATVGASRLNGIGATNLGRNQLKNYDFHDYQLQYVGTHWFAQSYMTSSNGGQTYQLNAFTQNTARYPTITADSARALSAFPGEGRLMAAELQNNFSISSLTKTGIGAIDNTHITWGGQLRRDRVSSYMHWLSDRRDQKAILLDQKGVYAQLETPLTEMFRVVLAGRYDKHERYDAQFSPKAALMFTPVADQTIRVTYNKAFKSPTVLQTDFYFPNFVAGVGVFGNLDGFDIKNAAGTITKAYDPIRPETNDTWELGYKGVVGQRLFVDVTGYRTRFQHFLSPLATIAVPVLGTTAYNHKTGAKVTDEAGANQIVLSYFNVGEGTIHGVDAGLRFFFTDKIAASGNVSLMSVDTIKALATDPPEATSFNSPSSRINAGMDFNNVVQNTTAGFTMRYVHKYNFRSGVNFGMIPAFGTLDLNGSYRLNQSARIMVQATNLYACTGGTSSAPVTGIASTVPAIYAQKQSCGFGKKHSEMLNSPEVGPTILAGLRFDMR